MESSTIAIIIILITIVSFILEKIPLAMTAMLSSIAMGIILPEMSLDDVYAGFSSSTVMMVAGMCVVGDSLFQTGMADKLGAALAHHHVPVGHRHQHCAVPGGAAEHFHRVLRGGPH